MDEFWEIEEGKVDSTFFFGLLLKYFGDTTTVFIEGTSIKNNVISCYQKNLDRGKFLPGRQTSWPKSKCFRCIFSASLIKELSQLSLKHAEPELMDHFSIYKNGLAILEWHDAFSNVMFISKSVPEEIVKDFSNELGLKYGEAKFS